MYSPLLVSSFNFVRPSPSVTDALFVRLSLWYVPYTSSECPFDDPLSSGSVYTLFLKRRVSLSSHPVDGASKSLLELCHADDTPRHPVSDLIFSSPSSVHKSPPSDILPIAPLACNRKPVYEDHRHRLSSQPTRNVHRRQFRLGVFAYVPSHIVCVLDDKSAPDIQATEVSKYQELRLRITLDGNIQESLESTLDAGVHTWREPFSL